MASNLDKYLAPNGKTAYMKARERSTDNVSNQSPSTFGVGQLIADGMNTVGSAIDTSVRTVTGAIDSVYSSAVDSVFTRGTSRIPQTRQTIQRNMKPVSQVISSNRIKDLKKEILTFPSDIGKYYLLLSFAQYRRPNGFEDATLDPIEVIALPMPDNLLETYSARWNQEDAGIYGEISSNIEKSLGTLKDIDVSNLSFENLRGLVEAAGLSSGAAAYRTGSTFFPTPFGILEQAGGFTPNPHPTVFFKGVDLRTHTFQWKFSPSSQEESDILKNIIKILKNRMLPSLIESKGTALSYPFVVKPELRPNENYLYSFKWCGIKSMNVIYTPDGMPAFYKSQAPVSVNLNIELQELEYFTSEEEASLQNLDASKRARELFE